MADYSIWVLEYGFVDAFPASSLMTAQPHQGHRRMPYCFGLLRSADHTVLVDTGYADPAVHQRLTGKYGTTNWSTPVEVLDRVGVQPADVDAILLTHNHLDHSGCVPQFPRAHVYVQRRELASYVAAVARPRRFEFLLRATDPKLPEVLTERESGLHVTYVNGYLPVTDRIELRPAFDTHTAGSQFALVENAADGRWLFAGDNVYTYQNVEGLAGDGVLEPIGTSTGSQSVWLDTIDDALAWVGRDTSRIVPFHEAELFRRFPSREYADGLHVAEMSLAGGHASVLPTAGSGPSGPPVSPGRTVSPRNAAAAGGTERMAGHG